MADLKSQASGVGRASPEPVSPVTTRITRRAIIGATASLAAIPAQAPLSARALSDSNEPASGFRDRVAATLAELKDAPTTNGMMLWDGAPFRWETANAPYVSDERASFVTTIESRHQALEAGAWVRQKADSIQFARSEAGATSRSAQDELQDLPVSPESFKAVGDGVSDDTDALQAAFNTGRSVRLTHGKVYLVRSALKITAGGVSVTGGGIIKVAKDFDIQKDRDSNGTHMRVIFITGTSVKISDVIFDATDAPRGSAVENGFIWSVAPFTTIRNCQFVGNPKGTCIWALSNAPYLSVIGCNFENCSGAVFTKGRNSVISNNIIINATDAAIAINGKSCAGSVISGNTISNERAHVIPSMIAVEESASNWSITGNVLTGANGGGIIATNILDRSIAEGGVISSNTIDGNSFSGNKSSSPNPAALIAISGSYKNCIVSDNKILNCSHGNPNSRLAIIPASGTIFSNNIVDGSSTDGISAMVEITVGHLGITIGDNITYGSPDSRHFLFGGGDYGSAPCTFFGGKFISGNEGINLQVNSAIITNINLEICNIAHSTVNKSLVNAADVIGDRASYLNDGAWRYPHKIGRFTEMHCTSAPLRAGRMPFQNGDKFYYLDPGAVGYIGTVKTSRGFVGFGRL